MLSWYENISAFINFIDDDISFFSLYIQSIFLLLDSALPISIPKPMDGSEISAINKSELLIIFLEYLPSDSFLH